MAERVWGSVPGSPTGLSRRAKWWFSLCAAVLLSACASDRMDDPRQPIASAAVADAMVGEIPASGVRGMAPSMMAAIESGLVEDEEQYDQMLEFATDLNWQHVRAGGVVQAARVHRRGVTDCGVLEWR